MAHSSHHLLFSAACLVLGASCQRQLVLSLRSLQLGCRTVCSRGHGLENSAVLPTTKTIALEIPYTLYMSLTIGACKNEAYMVVNGTAV